MKDTPFGFVSFKGKGLTISFEKCVLMCVPNEKTLIRNNS